jgi:hypothetical protein
MSVCKHNACSADPLRSSESWEPVGRHWVSPRSDFEALVQACEELGVEHEARTGHKAVQHVKIRRCGTTMMSGTGQELLKRSPDE